MNSDFGKIERRENEEIPGYADKSYINYLLITITR